MKPIFTKIKQFIFLLGFLCIAEMTFAQGTITKAFTSNDTWVIPDGVTEVTIECWGAGGAGSYMAVNWTLSAGAGGGGGAYAKTVQTVEPGKTMTIVVGAGGSGTQNTSGDGSESYVMYNSATVAKAMGGTGASNNAANGPGIGGQASQCIGDVVYSGGNGSGGYNSGVTRRSGGGGAAAGAGGDGGDGGNGSGTNGGTIATGSTISGNGGNGVVFVIAAVSGNAGHVYGGGGSGGVSGVANSANGGNGANGYVLLTYKDCSSITINPGTIVAETWVCSLVPDTTIILTNGSDASPAPGSYFWEISTDDGSTWSTVTGANTNNYTATATGWYRRGYNLTGCENIGYTSEIIVTHPSEIDPGIISDNRNEADTMVCYGNDLEINLSSTSAYIKIWQVSYDTGTTWTNIASVTPLTLTNVTTDVQIRHITQYSSSCEFISNNIYQIKNMAKPVINKLIPVDTCPGLDKYVVTADITPGSGTITTYNWTGIAPSDKENDTITATLPNCNTSYSYSLQVTDEYGCVSAVKDGSFKTPTLVLNDIPEQPAQLLPSECKYVIPNFKDTIEAYFNCSCSNMIDTFYCNPEEGKDIAANTTVNVNITVRDVCGTIWNKTVSVKATAIPDFKPEDVTFDEKNDTIQLYYGICDTLYNVLPPTYTTTSEYKDVLTLTNNRSTSNSGAILGRLSGETDTTITWTLSDPCGHSASFTKHYVVLYPKCGEGVTVTDVDGNEYQTVRVGCECWTKTNLKTTTVSDTSYVYQNDPANENIFGRLYTWYSAVGLPKDATTAPATTTDPTSNLTYVQGICPAGWAVPTVSSYINLNMTAGGTNNIKSNVANTWLSNSLGSDATGFGAVAGGYYSDSGFYYYNLLGEAYFWTCEGDPITKKAGCCSITHNCPEIIVNTLNTGYGISVRCVKRSND